MKRYLTLLIIISTWNYCYSQDSSSYKFEPPVISIDSSIALDVVFSGSCMCRLDPRTYHVADSLVSFLRKNPDLVIQIEHHTDWRDAYWSNWAYSGRILASLIDYIIDHGVSRQRIIPMPLGESQLKRVTEKDSTNYPFLKVGQQLNQDYVLTLTPDQQEICSNLNARTIIRIVEIKNYLNNK